MEKIIDYNGVLDQEIIGQFMGSIENNILNTVTMANISTIVIEMGQNMINYSKNDKEQSRDIEPAGSICVERGSEGTYYITGTNIVSIEDKEKIEPKLIEVKTLDKAGIKKRYKELRRSGENTHEKGGGIGTYLIAKLCDSIDYNFENINDDKYYFSLKTKLKSKAIDKHSKKNILLADDSLELQAQIKELFESKDFSVEIAANTQDILDTINEKQIDLIILSSEFKNLNSIEFLQKNHELIINLLKIPVFISCENMSLDIIKGGLLAGAKDVLKKPYFLEELMVKVDLWIDYKTQELEKKDTLKILQEYKDAVDESAIVSKADPRGFIIYANEQFCNISGYTLDELVGKNHNIVRHPDTPVEKFKDLWKTIKKEKKAWRGELKNRKKDGGYYWVSAFIKPILDTDGNIVEYIAIRTDITELKDKKC